MKIKGKQYYLWRAVDQDDEVVEAFLQARQNGDAEGDLSEDSWNTGMGWYKAQIDRVRAEQQR